MYVYDKKKMSNEKEDYIMNKAIKIASIVMLVVLMMGVLTVPALAANVNLGDFTGETNSGTQGITNLFNNIIGIVQVVGTGIAVIMLIVLAIKYLMAAPSEKADIKKGALIYVVAAVILFAAVNILAVIQEWSRDLNLL